tara:strand:- start:5258 stop:5410 length:153 start_codon:yes stop_codon:yes gene_type:complete
MVELLQLVEVSLVLTAVTITAVSAPVAIITGEPMPDITPLIETTVEEKGR